MTAKVKKWSAQEKLKIALEAARGQKTQAEITSAYGVHSTQILRWKQQLLSSASAIFDKADNRPVEQDQQKITDELYQQIGQLKMELEWLKKKHRQFEL